MFPLKLPAFKGAHLTFNHALNVLSSAFGVLTLSIKKVPLQGATARCVAMCPWSLALVPQQGAAAGCRNRVPLQGAAERCQPMVYQAQERFTYKHKDKLFIIIQEWRVLYCTGNHRTSRQAST